jgi:hypothetical protein
MAQLLDEKILMDEMQASHRMMGIKAFYEWADQYARTGKVE